MYAVTQYQMHKQETTKCRRKPTGDLFKEGKGEYKTIRIEWRHTTYMLIFDCNGHEEQANIIKPARQYFGRLTENVRNKIEETLPAQLFINMRIIQYYSCGIKGNKRVYSIEENELADWFEKASLI